MDLDDRPAGTKTGLYVWVTVIVIGIGIFAGASLLWDSLFGTAISGSIAAEGSVIGGWTFAPDVCESGFRRSFYGVRMFSSHDSNFAFLYVEDPMRGRSIEVKIPGKEQGYRFFEPDCATLDATVQTGAIINNVRSVSGAINLDCRTQGGSLKGTLKFENCH